MAKTTTPAATARFIERPNQTTSHAAASAMHRRHKVTGEALDR